MNASRAILFVLLVAGCTAAGGRRSGSSSGDTAAGTDGSGFTPGTDGSMPIGGDDATGTPTPDATDGSVDGTDGSVDSTDGSADSTDGSADSTDGSADSTDGSADGADADVTGSETPDTSTPVKDQDGDLIPDGADNCKAVSNADQADLDGDQIGDACDADRDGDGALDEFDCAPLDDKVSPLADERCNGIDDNCDNSTDPPDSKGCTPMYVDGDNDGAGTKDSRQCLCGAVPLGLVVYSGDCDDANGALNPFVPEACNGADDNCNLVVDDGCDDDKDGYCDSTLATPGPYGLCPNGGGDCQDFSPEVHPGATEVNADGVDNDCDGVKGGEGGTGYPPNCVGQVCTGATTAAMLCAMEMCYPGYVGAANVSSPNGDSTAGAWGAVKRFGNAGNDLAPFAGESYAVLSSGTFSDDGNKATAAPQIGVGLAGGIETDDPHSADIDDMNDVVEFKVTLTAPPGVTGFGIDYIFLSAEYEEYIGTSFNDKFYMLLKQGGATTIVNYTACSDPASYYDFQQGGQYYCYIAINTAFSEPCLAPATNINGTGYQCSTGSSTGWLTTQWPVTPGQTFDLVFHIHDTADDIYDSLVLLDNFRWLGGTFTQGTASHN